MSRTENGGDRKNQLFVVERNLKVTDETFRLSAHSRWSQITRYLCQFQIFLVDLNSLKLLALCNPLSVWRDCLLRCTFCTILTKKVSFRFKICNYVFSCIPGWLLWIFNWIQFLLHSRAVESQLPLLEDGRLLISIGKDEPDSRIAIFAICALNARDLK